MTLEEIKKSIECHYDYKCEICPNNEELGSGEIVCISRLLPEIINCINNLQSQLAEKDEMLKEYGGKYE